METTAALSITDLHKAFGQLLALRGVSFSLRPGERLGLLGPNGAGKTTLIRCLCGRTVADAGSIGLLGSALLPSSSRHSLGVVPQEIALYDDLTAGENLKAFARFHGLRGRPLRARVDWALQWTGLADRADRLVASFSGGMKQRVKLARGVMHEPQVLLLDEPTVGIDPQSRQWIFEMLDGLQQQGSSILLTMQVTMDELLLGKWIYLTGLGIAQTTLMFVWGQLLFGVGLWQHLEGFFVITSVTAGAASAFGLLLATLCRSRGQLNGLSVILILTMSALGGSMVPRYVMSEKLRSIGHWTFNAWALDGYDKIFWRDLPIRMLWPELAVLTLCGCLFLVAARLLAMRWECD